MSKVTTIIQLLILLLFLSCKRDTTMSCVGEMLDNEISLGFYSMEQISCKKVNNVASYRYLLHYPCYDWVYYNGQLVSFANGKYKANSNRCDECSGYYHAHACSLCQSAK